jgi:uncharacterized protein YndB with AHSA1/START domain
MTQDHEIDTRGQVEAVDRASTLRRDDDGAIHATVSLSQSYATDVEDLWDACSTAERLARWFAPVSGDLRLGGRFQIEGNAGGTIQTCDPPRGFTATWEFRGATSEIELRLEPDGDDRARLTLLHIIDGDPSHWDQFGPGAVGVGWDLALLGLSTHLATGTARPAENTAWAESEAAKAFMADSSARWGDAAVAGGTPEEEARAAEARTTAFYTGAST